MEEENLKMPVTRRAFGQVQTSVLISQEFYKLCKEHRIKFSEAMRIGISIILAERGVRDYDNNFNFMRKLAVVSGKLTQTSQKFWELIEIAKSKGVDVSQFEE